MKKTLPIVVIGGGMSGVMAAAKIEEKGLPVIILEQNSTIGGRMATNCMEGEKADYGAQFFTIRTLQFQKVVDVWERAGWVKHWFGDPYKRYKSIGGMKELVKNLAEGMTVKLNTKVVSIHMIDEKYYNLKTETNENIEARAVIVTAPAPQIITLFHNSQLPIMKKVKNDLKAIQFAPSIVAVVKLSESTSLLDSGHLDHSLPQGLERIVDHSKKGLSSQTIVSIYADGKWSKQHWDMDDQLLLDKLIEKSKKWINCSTIKTTHLKKWRYSEALSVIRKPFLNMELSVPFFAAGDAFLHKEDLAGRTRIESAVLSGIASGEAVIECLKNKG
ncbi:NAD(P)/FAD-dependent oxidoreductase [Bacillus taeanensis]|uniref:Amine oxidase domain-containing protein n=1 Tax=Bacillus taeanensis TaxID=273032 RepID=A0A366XTB9_9BACI|nr:FAD-dependent oxidoreductase [Bacillus taeanensis]RBW67989.1 hypothetical protein DS031_18795 [Bacillus taeanensis]